MLSPVDIIETQPKGCDLAHGLFSTAHGSRLGLGVACLSQGVAAHPRGCGTAQGLQLGSCLAHPGSAQGLHISAKGLQLTPWIAAQPTGCGSQV